MEPLKFHTRPSFHWVALMMTSLFIVIPNSVETSGLHCPSPCECQKERGEVNRITCTKLGLTTVPNLKPLEGSTISNHLYLDYNEIKEISKSDFPPGLNIVLLNLNSNKEIKISTDAFLNLGYSLRNLWLDGVDIAYDKTIDILDGLFSLEGLSLESNNRRPYTIGAASNVQVTLFQGEVAKNLKSLTLAYCNIRTMSDITLKGLTRLEELDLSNNWLTSIPSTINHLSNLKFVEFFYCKITSLEDNDFSGLTNLEEIDLSSNAELKTIGDKAFSGCENSLHKLNFQRCGLTNIPTQALSGLSKLDVLDLSENNFTNVGSSPLVGNYKLTQLAISSKNLVFDREMFGGQEENINQLSIPRMNLEIIPLEALKTLPKLGRLFLEYNNISTLPEGAFDGLSVHSIRLDNNPLSFIEPGAFNGLPPNLHISLSRTEMSDIHFLLGYSEDAIESVNLQYNNLACKCSMKDAIVVLQTINHISGDCIQVEGKKKIHITSSKLGPVLDNACEEEKRNSGNSLSLNTTFELLIASLLFAKALL